MLEAIFDDARHPLGAHIDLAQRGELLCVAPATANLLAKAAAGLADDLLSTLVLSFTGPILMAPAMNCEMWDKPAVRAQRRPAAARRHPLRRSRGGLAQLPAKRGRAHGGPGKDLRGDRRIASQAEGRVSRLARHAKIADWAVPVRRTRS